MKKKRNIEMTIREKVALAAFMEFVPAIISLWKEKAPEQTLDAFLLARYESGKELQKNTKKK